MTPPSLSFHGFLNEVATVPSAHPIHNPMAWWTGPQRDWPKPG